MLAMGGQVCVPVEPGAGDPLPLRSALLSSRILPAPFSSSYAGCIVEYKYVILDTSGRSVLSWQVRRTIGTASRRPRCLRTLPVVCRGTVLHVLTACSTTSRFSLPAQRSCLAAPLPCFGVLGARTTCLQAS